MARRLAPPPRLTVSQWADSYRRLSPESSAEPGRWDTSRAEYQRGMMDAISDPRIERVVFMTSARVGKTQGINNCIGFHIHQDPAPILMVLPTVDRAEEWADDEFDPMIRDSPALRAILGERKSRGAKQIRTRRQFPGGRLWMVGANAPSALAAKTVRVVLCDEVDRFPASAGDEGDPVTLAEKRSDTIWNRKIILSSTPTARGTSRIEAAYEASDKRRFWVPCPDCGHMQTLRWPQVRWPDGRPEEALYHCEDCGAGWDDAARWGAVRRGEWRAEAEFRGTAGFHLNELYSSFRKLAETARAFWAAKDKPEALKVWINTALGETTQEKGEAPDWQRLYDRREVWKPGHIPAGGLFCTAGVDVQRDRIEVSVWAWGRDKQSWLIDHRILPGNPFEAAVWRDLRAVLGEQWRHESGAMMGLSMTAVDSGDGTTTAEVYAWVRSAGPGVIAIKGQDALRQAIGLPSKTELRRNGAKLGGLKVWPVGSSYLKGETYGWLKLEQPTEESGEAYPSGFVHLPKHVASDEFCKQISAEQLIARATKSGFRRMEWVKQRERNEALDCRVYARAATAAMGMDTWSVGRWDRMAEALQVAPEPVPAAAAPIPAKTAPPPARGAGGGFISRRSGWLSGGRSYL